MTRAELTEQRIADASELYRPLLRRVYDGEASARDCIRAFCLSCVGYHRPAITNCSATACPLYLKRPYQNLQSTE